MGVNGSTKRLLKNRNVLYNTHRRTIIDYQTKKQDWWPAAAMTLGTVFFIEFIGLSSSTGSMDIDKLFPFSFGTSTQDKYQRPHCHIFTPYNKMKEQKTRERLAAQGYISPRNQAIRSGEMDE